MQHSREPIDVYHHLSDVAKKRVLSPLKGLHKYQGKPGIISLAGGHPNPEYFPFDTLRADVLPPDVLSTKFRLSGSSISTLPLTVSKNSNSSNEINIVTALQYGSTRGMPQLEAIVKQISQVVHKPSYNNFAVMVNGGNLDGWAKVVSMLCNPGEGVLVSEWTYPSAMSTMRPYDISPVIVGMDGEGMRSISLREVLSGWKTEERGMPRPHVMYIVPVGQNPTGATMHAKRKHEIYDICVQFDVIIVEDDPYYFLQEGPYTPKKKRNESQNATECHASDDEYLASLVPSFLRLDYQGRVIRLDSFSKTVAPGSRIGWFTCHPLFAERLERVTETSTNQPCGFGQAMIASLLLNWGLPGYFKWLRGIGIQYTERRDYFLDCFAEKFRLETCTSPLSIWDGSVSYAAYAKLDGDDAQARPIFSFVPPTSGMFVWLRMHFRNHPQISELNEETLEQQLWAALAEAGLLIAPGTFFAANPFDESVKTRGYFRLSFSKPEYAELNKAVDIFSTVTREFFGLL